MFRQAVLIYLLVFWRRGGSSALWIPAFSVAESVDAASTSGECLANTTSLRKPPFDIIYVRTQLEDVKRGYLLKLRAGVPTPSSLHLPTAPLAAAVESGDFKHASDTLLEGKGGSGEWTRKYFMLDGGKLTFHASHSSTLVVQGSFKLPPTTQVIFVVNP